MGWYITFLILFDNGGRAVVESDQVMTSKKQCISAIDDRVDFINTIASRPNVKTLSVGCSFRRKA